MSVWEGATGICSGKFFKKIALGLGVLLMVVLNAGWVQGFLLTIVCIVWWCVGGTGGVVERGADTVRRGGIEAQGDG